MATRPIPRVTAMRYVQPLREGGSLPAVVDTEDGLYVVKFRGGGQGPKALVAELIVGLLGLGSGSGVPQLALVDLPPPFGRSEPDPEIQDLLRRSHGVNVGLRYLDGAFNFDPTAAGTVITPEFAARVVWLDALVTNPDRTHRNPNLLVGSAGRGSSTTAPRSTSIITGPMSLRRRPAARFRWWGITSCWAGATASMRSTNRPPPRLEAERWRRS